MTDAENIRFKIVHSLIKSKKPMKLSEIAKETNLRDHHVLYHLKSLKKIFLVKELEGKKYICQPFLINDSIYEDLKDLMSVIIRIITREIELPDRCPADKRAVSIIKNLEAFIRSYSAEILGYVPKAEKPKEQKKIKGKQKKIKSRKNVKNR